MQTLEQMALPSATMRLGSKSRKVCRMSPADRKERRQKIMDKRAEDRKDPTRILVSHGKTDVGREGKTVTREVKKAVAYLDYVIGSQESNKVIKVHNEPLLSRTPTTAREIKESYIVVTDAKKAARMKAMDSVGGERDYANKAKKFRS